jgi:F-type H+-transporting ATPase subunit a
VQIEPMKQFLVQKIIAVPIVTLPGGLPVDLSITNSVLFMIISASVISLFFMFASKGNLVPGRLQALAELSYELIDRSLTGSMIGERGRPFLPFIFAIFSLIATVNVLGLLPGSFTPTSQLSITITLALISFTSVIVVGVLRHGPGMFKLFVPAGISVPLAIVLAPIEFVLFFVRPVTLSMRLFGNMVGGHVVLYMFAAFVVSLGLFSTRGGFATLGVAGSLLSLAVVVALYALELIVAVLQAYVFAALTCLYLADVVNLDRGH